MTRGTLAARSPSRRAMARADRRMRSCVSRFRAAWYVSRRTRCGLMGRELRVRFGIQLQSTRQRREFRDLSIANRGTPDRAALVDRDTFWKAGVIFRRRVGNERPDDAVVHAADADAPVESRVVAVLSRHVTRLGVRNVQSVVENPNAARTPELPPFGNELASWRKNLDAIVVAVADKDAALRIERDRVRAIELPRPRALRSPCLYELAVPVEVNDPAI